MWHRKSRRRLGLVREHRTALLRNLVVGLVDHHRIRTTYARAKEASSFADRLVTIAKRGDLHARRLIISKLSSPPAAKKLVEQIAPIFQEDKGGYTRVLRYDFRPGDGAQMAFLEFTKVIEKQVTEDQKKKKKKKEKPSTEEVQEVSREKLPKKSEKKPPKAEKKAKTQELSKQEPSDKKESAPGTSEKQKPDTKKEVPLKEEPKKGGFLGSLRKFLTGE